MRLIGMLDSPYVRRVAVSMELLALPYVHEPLSVFRNFAEFAAVNPVVKAPTLVLDDGTVLLDSTLILQVLARLAAPGTELDPSGPADFIRSQRIVGLALAACEKAVQIVYERKLRPEQAQYGPWLERVTGQLDAACSQLDAALAGVERWRFGERPLQADISSAVAWRFIDEMLPDFVGKRQFPALSALSLRAEATAAFKACPFA